MNDLTSILRGAILLDQPTFERLRDSKNAMRTGVLILLVVFLIAGSLQFVFDLAQGLQRFTEEDAAEYVTQFEEGMNNWLQFMPQEDQFSRQFMEQFMENFKAGVKMGVAIDQQKSPLPRGLAKFLEALGSWFSSPFGHLGAWLGYAIWVLLFARLLGGTGGLDRFLGVTALYAVPNLLSFFRPIPIIGGLLALIGVVWGWAVYVKAVQVSQRFDMGKAILVTVLPLLILILLLIVMAVIAILAIIAAAAGS